MRNRSRAFRALSALLLAGPLAGASAGQGTEVQVSVTALRSEKGLVQACLTSDPKRFPDCDGDPTAHTLSAKASAHLVLEFGHVAPGHYAISLLHDENGNGKVDRTLMIPTEGFGFSRDAKLRMGPPSFESAAFDVGSTPVRQSIRMRYLF